MNIHEKFGKPPVHDIRLFEIPMHATSCPIKHQTQTPPGLNPERFTLSLDACHVSVPSRIGSSPFCDRPVRRVLLGERVQSRALLMHLLHHPDGFQRSQIVIHPFNRNGTVHSGHHFPDLRYAAPAIHKIEHFISILAAGTPFASVSE